MNAAYVKFILPAALLAAGATCAQEYPTKTVRLIVPFAPGGATDVLARIIGQKLGEAFGPAVVIDNRPGATGLIGMEIVGRPTGSLRAADVDSRGDHRIAMSSVLLGLFAGQGDEGTELLGGEGVGTARAGGIGQEGEFGGRRLPRRRLPSRVFRGGGPQRLADVSFDPLAHGVGTHLDGGGDGGELSVCAVSGGG